MEKRFSLHSEPLARDDQPLKDHLIEVAYLGKKIWESLALDEPIYPDIIMITGLLHDIGKATPWFQEKLFKKIIYANRYTYHSDTSSIIGYYVTKKYLENRELLNRYKYLPLFVYLAIYAHHSSLCINTDFYTTVFNSKKLIEHKINDGLSKYRDWIDDILRLEPINGLVNFREISNNALRTVINDFYQLDIFDSNSNDRIFKYDIFNKINLLYSTFLEADRLSAAGLGKSMLNRRGTIPPDLIDKYVENLGDGSSANKIRRELYNNINKNLEKYRFDDKERVIILNLPTGSGKTYLSLNIAVKLAEHMKEKHGVRPRIIYVLPYLSIIDQLSSKVEEILKFAGLPSTSRYLLVHHHLSEARYKGEDNELYKDDKALLLIEGWYGEIIITTFIQFFNTIFSVRNSSSRRYHKLANSITILDEIQTIPYKYWDILREAIIYITSKYNSIFILSTATLPKILEKGYQLINNNIKMKAYREFSRRRFYNFMISNKVSLNSFLEKIIGKRWDNILSESTLFVMNTINSASKTFNYILNIIENNYNVSRKDGVYKFYIDGKEFTLGYLSGHLLPIDRLNRIRVIKNTKNKLVVSTQVVEAGVDISFKKIYRDLAPLDSIIQTGGRSNRNFEFDKGEVIIMNLSDQEGRTFSSMIYDRLEIDAVFTTFHGIDKVIEESTLYSEYLPKYYEYLSEYRDVFRLKKENILNFCEFKDIRLIEDLPYKIDVFIEYDNNATNIWNKYMDTLEIKDKRERYRKFLEIKKHLYAYTISVNKNYISKISDMLEIITDDFVKLPKEYANQYYRKDIGLFIPEEYII